jgi:hypothetical protein
MFWRFVAGAHLKQERDDQTHDEEKQKPREACEGEPSDEATPAVEEGGEFGTRDAQHPAAAAGSDGGERSAFLDFGCIGLQHLGQHLLEQPVDFFGFVVGVRGGVRLAHTGRAGGKGRSAL